ncbi:MAG TPA: hypothetical protein VMO26_27675 [Vicinamibacterales bacterium]|nr:hypothetical protein [Vicinamibacterales bacterium]
MATYRPNRPIEAYTAPFPFVDIGADGVRGTADDRTISLLGLPAAQAANFPVNQVVMNTGVYGRYKTAEASINRRYSNRWSASMGGAFTWRTTFPNAFPNDPNAPGAEDETFWNFKLTGSYDAPFGVRVSPLCGTSRLQLRPHHQRAGVGRLGLRPDLQRADLRRAAQQQSRRQHLGV